MKILFAHNSYLERGGEDVEVEAEISLLNKAGHQTYYFHRSNHEIQKLSAFGKIGFLAGEVYHSRYIYSEFRKVIQAFKPDVVHVHNTFLRITPSIYNACLDAGVPVVQTFHNYRMLCPAGTFFRSGAVCQDCFKVGKKAAVQHRCWKNSRVLSRVLTEVIEKLESDQVFQSKVKVIIVPSQFAKDQFVRAGFQEKNIFVNPNVVDLKPLERSSGAKSDYALFAGRLADYKGVHELIAIFKQCPNVRLKIVGDGPLVEEIRTEAKNFKHIELLGQLDHSRLVEEISKARFVIFPSVCFETFGRVIVEAYACGVPVLASDVGAARELVKEGQTGYLFNPSDIPTALQKIRLLAGDQSLAENLGKNARSYYDEHLSAQKSLMALENIYRLALNNN